MSSVGEAYFTGSVHSQSLGIAIRPVPQTDATQYLNIRLSNGDAFYTAGGTSVSGGSIMTADQGAPSLLSSAWPVKITDGSSILGTIDSPQHVILVSGSDVVGTQTHPVYVSGTVLISNPQQTTTALSGSAVAVLIGGVQIAQNNPVPVQQLDVPNLQYRYDIGTGTIYYGYAQRTLQTNESVWTIKKTVLDSSGNPTQALWSITGSWDSRISLLYT